MSYLIDFFIAYILTNIIEFIPFNFLIKGDLKFKSSRLILINSITLPLFWALLYFVSSNFYLIFLIGEIFIALGEAVLIKYLLKQSWQRALVTSVTMNFLSALAGFFI